jgi:ergothioneine biosynthesis protein EgtB
LFYLRPFEIESRLVTCGEYLEFMEDGGYENPLLWLDSGWIAVQSGRLCAPLYWERTGNHWSIWTLAGELPLERHEPVCHVSFYEADAFARWKGETHESHRGARLPSEREWEHAAVTLAGERPDDVFFDPDRLHPTCPICHSDGSLQQMAGCVWQWTSSYYDPYPGYEPFPGVMAEYNAKFMDNQRVLRGGSCATPHDHYRHTYRNFWPAHTRFQFSGIRLARDCRE